jgi:hypothetical protein
MSTAARRLELFGSAARCAEQLCCSDAYNEKNAATPQGGGIAAGTFLGFRKSIAFPHIERQSRRVPDFDLFIPPLNPLKFDWLSDAS